MRARWHHILVARGGMVFAAVLATYGALACTHFVDGDNAELATLGSLGGAAHPSGYPLYVLWLRATSWLPAASPAHATALATAFLGALAAWVAFLGARAWGARPVAAALAAGIYAASPLALQLATEAEVFTLNQLVAATILWLAAAGGPLRGRRRVVALAVVAGLGLSDHMTCGLLAPVGLVGAVRGVRECTAGRGATVALAVAAFVAGLSPYAYLLVAPDSAASWGAVRSWPELVRHVLRDDYGGPGALSAHGEAQASDQLGALAWSLARGWLWVPLLLGLGTLGYRAARAPGAPTSDATEPRAGWIALAAAWVLAGPVLAAKFNLPPTGHLLSIVVRFHLLPTLLLVPAVACGLDALVARLPARATAAAWAGTVVLVAVALWRSVPEVRVRHSAANELAVRDVLGSLPPDSVLVTTGTTLYFGATYLQTCAALRPDVVAVTWSMTTLPWYRDRLARRGFTIEPGERSTVPEITRQLALGRAVFVDAFQRDALFQLPHYPYGAVYRVLPRGAKPPPAREVFDENARLFVAWARDGAHAADLAAAPGDLGALVAEREVEMWTELAHELAAAGDTDAAARATAYAARLAR